ncbi:MAG: alanine--glyoxylate aminotransferase family protein [Acidobacteriota bacterium]|jgi:aspartate aminotransferase-like enzyme
MLKKPRLFTAGPTPLHPDAMRAASGAVPYHRTPEFAARFQRVQKGLQAAFRTAGPVAVLTTSGTGAMEAALASLFAAGDRVVVIAGGKFGERWAEIGRAYALDVVEMTVPPGHAVTPAAVAQQVAESTPVRGLFLTASETSTGTLYEVQPIVEAVRGVAPEIVTVVDAITSVGALPIATDDWGLDAVIGGAQKAFMVPPGLAFVACSPRGWQLVDNDSDTPRYYLDLRKYAASAHKSQTPFTPGIGLLLALEASLDAIAEAGGIGALEDNAARLASACRAAAAALDLELLSHAPSPAVTAIKAPEPGTAPEIVAAMRDRHGAQLSGGQGDLKPDIFRIGHIGYVDDLDLLGVLAALEGVLADRGHAVTAGAGVAAAAADLAAGR